MEYFSGLFDAEGYVTIGKDGHFQVGTEMTNEEVPNLFQKQFGGHIYERKRGNRKKTWTWVIASDTKLCYDFINAIAEDCIVKAKQLFILKDYLEHYRENRRIFREGHLGILSKYKEPLQVSKEFIETIPFGHLPTECFWKWLAGFFDGDGNFCVYEYEGKKSKIFDSWVGIFNTFPDPICFMNSFFRGSISQYKGTKFPIWKWVCNQKDSELVCNELLPHLKIKKEQCQLVLKFLDIKKTKTRSNSYSFDHINEIRDIIKQIKHLNSL